MAAEPVIRGILGQRSAFSLAYRLAVRAGQGAELRDSKSIWRIGLLGSALGDIGLAGLLRKTDRPLLVPRILADGLDAALWSQIPSENVELAVLPGVPLAIESGYRYGLGGLVAPLSAAALTSMVQVLRKKPVTLAPFRWQVLATAFGIAAAMLETRYRDEVLSRAHREGQARTYRAWLVGQNDVAMGADSVVDDLCRISPLLGDEVAEGAIGPLVRAWKQSLATNTETGSVYLGNALAQWQRRHNDFQPDLSADVWFDLAPGYGTHVLTVRQAEWLAETCDHLALKGKVPVSAETPAQGHRPGTHLLLTFGSTRVEVPADDEQDIRALDLGAIGLAVGAYWVFDSTTSKNAQCARWAVWPISAVSAFAAAWAQRQVVTRGDASHGTILAVTCATSIAQAVASSLTIRQPVGAQGRQRLPFMTGLTVVGIMLPLYWRDLDRDQRCGVISALVATLGLGTWLYPERIVGEDFARELLWIAAASSSTARLRGSLDQGAKDLKGSLAEQSKDAEERAFDDGRSFVVQLVSEAKYSLERQLGQCRHLDGRLRAEAEHRLHAVEERMKGLRR
jgi:hypothetical protein